MDKIKHKYILKIILIVILVTITWLVIMPHNTRILGDGYWYEIEGKRVFGPDISIPPTAKIIECTRDYIIVEQYPLPEREEAIYEYEYNYPYGRDTTNYIKKLIKNIIFMQVMIQTHQYMVDYLLLLQRLDG